MKLLVKNNTITLEGLTQNNYRQAMREALQFKEKTGNSFQGTITKNVGGALLKISEGISSDPLRPSIVESGFSLGDFCSSEIITSTNNIINGIFQMIDFQVNYKLVPKNYRDSIKIDLNLTGKSDGYRIGKTPNGTCKMKYNEPETISGTYHSYWTKTDKNVVFNYGSRICDDDLAFLRCHCSYKQAIKVLEGYKFPISNLNTKFFAKVFDEKGEKYRGVDIGIEIKNLFAYNLSKIKLLQKEQKQIEELIYTKEGIKKTIDEGIIAKNEKLKAKRTEVKEYVNSILKKRKIKKMSKKYFGIFN